MIAFCIVSAIASSIARSLRESLMLLPRRSFSRLRGETSAFSNRGPLSPGLGLLGVFGLGISLFASGCSDDPQIDQPSSTTGQGSSGDSGSGEAQGSATGNNSGTTGPQEDSSGSGPEGVELAPPSCKSSPAMPALTANTMVLWQSLPIEESAIGQDITGMGKIIVASPDEIYLSGARKVHRLELGKSSQCSWASPNANEISISAIALPAGKDALVVSFRNPNQKEGQMGLYLDQGKRFVHAKTPMGDPASSLLVSPDPQGQDRILGAFPGRLFSLSSDQGRTWQDKQTRQDALFTEITKDRNGIHVWALGKDTSGAGVVTWVPAADLDNANKTHTSHPAKWRWDASNFEIARADPHNDHSLLFGTTALSTSEPLLARATASPELGTLNVREIWTGPSTTTFAGVTAILALPDKADEFLLGGRGKKSGASPLLYRNAKGETQSIAVDTERKLQVLDLVSLGQGAQRKFLVSSTDGSELFLHFVGELSVVPEGS